MKLLKELIRGGDKIMLIALPGCGDRDSFIFRIQGIFSQRGGNAGRGLWSSMGDICE